MAGEKSKPHQLNFLIGPPFGPDELKALYGRAELGAKAGDHSLTQKLFELRKAYVVSVANPPAGQTSMLQRILEEKTGKQIAKLDVTISHSYLRGEMVPCLTVALQTSTFTDGSSIGGDFSDTLMTSTATALQFVFKAEWVQPSLV